eukprot:TRINITY_DN40264_c0_g1_i1.p1 TRINITY_DN40264_c0_g1~~TRINITY_DN40264_c0_g1_i1.p1  ORF type:complete len:407 (-),score=87.36 TRINITY_DN40264_c0_g1_i1:81-1280(-)
MSRFSTIDNQHSALRDLERQRLERLMGQLRREIEPKAGEGGKLPSRRFQPPRRKGERSNMPTAKLSAVRAPSPRPVEDADVSSENAPSAEMAWLLRARERMDEEAGEVEAFLTKHGLEQFASLLADSPGALGASMEALLGATEESLSEAGVPASPRRRLLQALKEDEEPSATLQEAPALGLEAPGAPRWGSLGRLPAGWHRCVKSGDGRIAVATRSEPTTHTDACIGDDSPMPMEEELGWQASTPSNVAATAVGTDEAVVRPPSAPAPPQRPPSTSARVPVPATSRPGTACSTSSASGGSGEKACCYQCYRQVYAANALQLPPEEEAQASRPATPATPAAAAATALRSQRLFCSENCLVKYRQVLAARSQREAELFKLRSAVERQGDAEVAPPVNCAAG